MVALAIQQKVTTELVQVAVVLAQAEVIVQEVAVVAPITPVRVPLHLVIQEVVVQELLLIILISIQMMDFTMTTNFLPMERLLVEREEAGEAMEQGHLQQLAPGQVEWLGFLFSVASLLSQQLLLL